MRTLAFAHNSLIVLCGPAGCGKSYFAQKFFRPSQVVSSDQCRWMISDDPNNQRVSPEAFELMDRIIEYRLKYNRLTVADATHLVATYRRALIDLAHAYGRPIYLVAFETDFDGCCRHNALRSRQVETEVIAKQVEKFWQIREQLREEAYWGIHYVRPQEIDELKISISHLES